MPEHTARNRPSQQKPQPDDEAVAATWKREDPRMTADRFEKVVEPDELITKFRGAFRSINVQRNGKKIVSFTVDPQDKSAVNVFDDYAGIIMVCEFKRIDYLGGNNDVYVLPQLEDD